MWTALRVKEDKAVSKIYNRLENKFIDICSRYISSDDKNLFMVDIDGVQYNVEKSIYYILIRSRTKDLSLRLAPNIGFNELKRYTEIIGKPESAKSNSKMARCSDKTRAVDTEVIAALTCLEQYSMYFDMVAAITQVNASLFGKLVSEIINISIVMLKAYDEDYFINDLTLHGLVVYYWASQFPEFVKYRDRLWPAMYIKSKRRPGIHKDETLSEFIHRMTTTKFSADLAVRLLKDEYSTDKDVFYILYDNFDDIIKSVKMQTVNSSYLQEQRDNIKQSILDGNEHMPLTLLSLIGKKNITSYAYASMAASYIVPMYASGYNMYIVLLWILHEYKDKGNTKVISEDRLSELEIIAHKISELEISKGTVFLYRLFNGTIGKTIAQINDLDRKLKAAIEESKGNTEKLAESRSTCKLIAKEKNRLESQLAQLRTEIEHLRIRMQNSDISVDDFEAKQQIITRLTNSNDELKRALDNQSRKTTSTLRQLDDSRKEVERCKRDMKKSAEKIGKLEELNRKLLASTEESKVKQSAYVNAIKDKKITIIGGMKFHSRIQSLGLNNLRLFEEECKSIQSGDIVNQDLVVVITSFVDHSSIAKAVRTCRQNKVKLLNYNNVNADSLVYAMFSEIYG